MVAIGSTVDADDAGCTLSARTVAVVVVIVAAVIIYSTVFVK
jgi:hypothetical protein